MGSESASEYISFEYRTYRGESGSLNLLSSSKCLRLHHKDVCFINLSEIGELKNLQSIDLQNNHLEFIDLSEISECRDMRNINLSSNRLVEIDLEPLKRCEHLERFSISRNLLECLDISPFKGLKGLYSLSFAENNIQTIDLFPLAHCENLRSLNLLGNLLHRVNLAPILMCPHLERVELSGNPSFQGTLEEGSEEHPFSAILIDTLVKNAWHYGKPAWLVKVQSVHDISLPQFSEMIKRLDWMHVRTKIGQLLRKPEQYQWFENQKEILSSLNMSELIGLDATFRDILLQLPKLCDYKEGKYILYQKIVEMIREQLENKGSTHFFDIDKMSTTEASVLIPRILDRRKTEIEETVLAIRNGKVYLRPLWRTSYGFEILKKLGMRDTTDLQGLKKLEKTFSTLDMQLRSRDVKHWPFGESTINLSIRMQMLLNDLAKLPVISTY